jgi:hypothetical protein
MKISLLLHYGKYGKIQLGKHATQYRDFGYILRWRNYPRFALYIYWMKED